MARLKVLDPRAKFPFAAGAKSCPTNASLDDLNGRVVGLLNHLGSGVGGSLPGTDPFFEALKNLLESKYHVGEIIWRTKQNQSRLAPKEIADELATKTDVVINGTCS